MFSKKAKIIIDRAWGFLKSRQPQFMLLIMIFLLFLVFKQSSYSVYLGFTQKNMFLILWIAAIIILKLESRISIMVGILFLFLSALLLMVKLQGWVERTSSYVFDYLSVGVIQSWIEFFSKKKK